MQVATFSITQDPAEGLRSAMMTESTLSCTSPAQVPVGPESVSISMAGEADREEIYRARHAIYACELAQHPVNASHQLQDELDGKNIYIVARVARRIAGFVSITPPKAGQYSIDKYFSRGEMPFVVDQGLFEVRLLTVMPPYRGSRLALLLMYAAFRWVESHGGNHVVAIGRREILDLYLKAGLKSAGKTTRSGRVTYDLLHATVAEIREGVQQFSGALARFEGKVGWHLNFKFEKPAPCFHGGAFFKAIGEKFESLDRTETIINADVLDAWFPPSPQVTAALTSRLEWLLRTSPPTGCEGLVEHIARARGVSPRNILPGAGSSDLIFRALPHWLSHESHVLILDPTYGEYAHVLEKVIGATVDRLKLFRQDSYDLDLERFERALRDNYDLIVLVNPNSPTGRHVPRHATEALLRNAPPQTRIWIDETYVDFVDPAQSLEKFAAESENVIVCKSMSKAYGLSGARVAYLCAGAHQLESLRSITPPWVVSLLAQVAATMALRDPEYYAKRYAETHVFRQNLTRELSEFGCQVIEGTANFLLCHLPENGPSADQLIARCQRDGVFVRNAGSMGTELGDRAIRIAVKDSDTNARMLRIIKGAMESWDDVEEVEKE